MSDPIITFGIEWNVNQGVAMDEPAAALYLQPKILPHAEYKWDDEVARLVEGPEQLVGYYVEGRVFRDEATPIPDTSPQDYTVSRTYPAYTCTSLRVVSNVGIDWEDPENPAKPFQMAGPIVTRHTADEDPVAMAGGAFFRTGIHETNAVFHGFVPNKGLLPALPPLDDAACFLIDLETGRGYIWGDGVPGGTRRWMNTGVVQPPESINVILDPALDEIDQLPVGELDAPNPGVWQVVRGEDFDSVYEYTEQGWRNIGPVQDSIAFHVIDPEVRRSYVSGYIYPLVFNQSSFRYVPRLAPDTQDTYQGDIGIETTGWFPMEPRDDDRNIYPMDSVTSCLPDDRELVTIKYTFTMETDLASHSIDVYQDVYQPTYKWENVIRDLLDNCYYTHGIYH